MTVATESSTVLPSWSWMVTTGWVAKTLSFAAVAGEVIASLFAAPWVSVKSWVSELKPVELKVRRLVPTRPVLPTPEKVARPDAALTERVPVRACVEVAPTAETATATEAVEVVTVLS